MFTSPAYSAVRSNNVLSRYPEGWCRLEMSNLYFLQHGCWNAVLISQFDAVRPDTSCYTLFHPHQKNPKKPQEIQGKGLSRAEYGNGPWLCGIIRLVIFYLSADRPAQWNTQADTDQVTKLLQSDEILHLCTKIIIEGERFLIFLLVRHCF